MEVALVNVFQQELRVLKELEKLTYDLERRPDYSTLAVYRAADRHNEGKLDTINLERFFRSLSIYLSERELLALIRRIDTTADQNITYEELRDFLEEQVGFRSHQAVVSMAKATPEVRSYMHNDI